MTRNLKVKRIGAKILFVAFFLQCLPFSHLALANNPVTPTPTVTATTNDEPSYVKLRQIDLGTFNEYRYKLTEQYFTLREKYNVDGTIDPDAVTVMADLATKGYRYLPDNLNNKNRYNDLMTEIKKSIKYPNSDVNYTSLVKSLQNYLESTDIKSVTGTIEATPTSGNAPLTVTLRAKITDPTGTQIPSYNYVWRIDNAGKREIIGTNVSINYTFREEGNYAVFLDVVSNHKNESGYTDVLPFSSRADIQVQEKIASLIVKVNGLTLGNQDSLKFTPDEGMYGLIFDATSSTPTSGTKFIRTEWDFGNGIQKIYNSGPRVERVIYATEGEFPVTLKMTTNELKTIERQFTVSLHRPIATIQASSEEGYMGSKITFSSRTSSKEENLTYAWELIDIDKDESVIKKEGTVFDYTFTKKGKFNVKLTVTNPSGDTDVDTKIIYINSRPPVAEFSTKVQKPNHPNTIVFDASRSYDPDYTDDGNLKYNWIMDGQKVVLENANYNGSVGTYTFDSVGDHSVALEVTDPDGLTDSKKSKASVASILAVDLTLLPRVIQRNQFVRFGAESKEGTFYEWDFGDGEKASSKTGTTTHIYKKSGIFNVKVTVNDVDNAVNTDTKKVYVGNSDAPVAVLQVEKGTSEEPIFDSGACGGDGAYITDRITPIRFGADDSINIDGQTTNLEYSWKVGQDKFSTAKNLTTTFDELGCFPVKLTVTSTQNGRTDSAQTMVEVRNIPPTLSSLQVSILDPTTDPVVVNVSALGAKDPDGVIQNFLWYYYTDTNNDPQDFRATTQAKTTFVLPKITGNYYFVAVMKDNNEVKVTSEEIAGQKYSITLSGDNVNTPIIDLTVNNSSVSVGDSVVFTAQAKNILGQDIGPKADYYWDFDGDGFYDKQTKENSVTFAYQKAGEFFPKVKVKNKGFSNVRNIQVDVTNKIMADFNYISIGNKFVFLNTSGGMTDSVIWNLGDGTKVEGKDIVTHTYASGASDKIVELTVADGTKVKRIAKKLIPDIKNVLEARQPGLNVFSSPAYGDKNKITLDKPTDKAYIYLGESKGEIAKYAIDFDTETDSDLNGGKDDDEDNKGTSSYLTGDPVEVKLNNKRVQKIRVFIKDNAGVVLDSKDLEIEKSYIAETGINVSTLQFTTLTPDEKVQMEKVKTFISNLPESHRNDGLKLLSQLQENWIDETEKTKTILSLETFLESPDIQGGTPIVDILETLLVTGQDDKSQKNVAFNALKSLLPDALTCTPPDGSSGCKAYLVTQLETIKSSNDLEANKKTGTDVLKILEAAQGMTDSDKLDFKAVLKTFVYGGVNNIPTTEKQAVIAASTTQASSGVSGTIMNVLWYIFLGLAGIIGLFALAAIAFWIYFKISNKDEDVGFQDFIIKKTGGGNGKDEDSEKEPLIDVLSDTTTDTKASDSRVETSQGPSAVSNGNDLPDWLKGASDFSSQTEQQPQAETPDSTPVKETPQEKDLSTEPSATPDNNEADIVIPATGESQQSEKTQENNWLVESADQKSSGTESSKDGAEAVPDWLKGAFDDTPTDETSSDKNLEETISTEPQEEGITQESAQAEPDKDGTEAVPDWLKGAFDDTPTDETSSDKGTEETAPTESPEESTSEESTPQTEESSFLEPSPKVDTKVKEDLTIPDWLKGSFEDAVVLPPPVTEESAENKEEVQDVGETSVESAETEDSQASEEPGNEATSTQDQIKKRRRRKKKPATTQPPEEVPQPSEAPAKPSASTDQTTPQTTTQTGEDDLWQDGMKIPDWLQDSTPSNPTDDKK